MKFIGNFPKDGRVVAEFDGWVLAERTTMSQGKWVSLKLFWEKGKLETKANYWIGWDKESGKLAHTRDRWVLENNNPELFGKLIEVLGREFGK